jgi:hypothetical protein
MACSAAALARCEVSLPAVGEGLPNTGCAATEAAASASAQALAAVSRRDAEMFVVFMSSLLVIHRRHRKVSNTADSD